MNKVYGLYDVNRDYLIQSFRNKCGNVKTAMYSSKGNAIRGLKSLSNYYDSVNKVTVSTNKDKIILEIVELTKVSNESE